MTPLSLLPQALIWLQDAYYVTLDVRMWLLGVLLYLA